MAAVYFLWIVRLKGKQYPIQIQKYPNIRPEWTPKSGSCIPLVCTNERWDRIWSAGGDSKRILSFSFGPGYGTGVKNL